MKKNENISIINGYFLVLCIICDNGEKYPEDNFTWTKDIKSWFIEENLDLENTVREIIKQYGFDPEVQSSEIISYIDKNKDCYGHFCLEDDKLEELRKLEELENNGYNNESYDYVNFNLNLLSFRLHTAVKIGNDIFTKIFNPNITK